MKSLYVTISGIMFLAMILFPLFSLNTKTSASVPPQDINSPTQIDPAQKLKLYIKAEEKIVEVDWREYLIGVVAAEINAGYEIEALKAQAVAAYTYTVYTKSASDKTAEYDISDDSGTNQAYINVAQRKEKWGENFELYENKINEAVASVEGQLIVYDEKPALTVYHDLSAGKTESAVNVWGKDYPYLTSVESAGDVLCNYYVSENHFSEADFKEKIASFGCSLDPVGADLLGEISKTGCGTVLSISLGGVAVTGHQLRAALGLKSASFDVVFADGNYNFTVRGNGHGVGMSQFGAQFMALQGSNYMEILSWYYPSCQLISKSL